jgi:hypothetical protein
MECICWKVEYSHLNGGDWKGGKKIMNSIQESITEESIRENNINSVEVHPQLINNSHIMDGAIVGAGYLWPF